MIKKSLLTILESPTHPDLSSVYRALGINETKVTSMRKAINEIKKNAPDYIVAEFFYGYGNNYAGVNISNLDVMLHALQRYGPQTRVIVIVDKSEAAYVEKLSAMFPIHAVLEHPVAEKIKLILSEGTPE